MQGLFIVDDVHAPPPKDEGGPDEDGKPDFLGQSKDVLGPFCTAVLRLPESKFCNQRGELAPVSCIEQPLEAGSDNRGTRLDQVAGKVQWSLSPQLDDHLGRTFEAKNLLDLFGRQALHIETIGDVEVGRDCLRVAVDHDGFPAQLA